MQGRNGGVVKKATTESSRNTSKFATNPIEGENETGANEDSQKVKQTQIK